MAEQEPKKAWPEEWRIGLSPVGCVRTSEELNRLSEQQVQLYYVSARGKLCVVERVEISGSRVLAQALVENSRGTGTRVRVSQSLRACGLNKSRSSSVRMGYFFSTPEAAVKYAAWVKEGVRVQMESEK